MATTLDISSETPRLTDVRIRMWIIGAVLGFLGKKVFGGAVPDELAPILGAILGEVYDWAAFRIKRWWASEFADQGGIGSALIIGIALALLGLPAVARSQTSTSIVYEPATKQTHEVIGTRIGTIRNALGLKYDIPVIGFAGIGPRNRPLGGFALAPSIRLADNVSASIGAGAFISSAKPSGIALFAGLTWDFGPRSSAASRPVSLRALATDVPRHH